MPHWNYNPNPVIAFYGPEDNPSKFRANLNCQTMGLLLGRENNQAKRTVRFELIDAVGRGNRVMRIIADPNGEGTVTLRSNGNGTLAMGNLSKFFTDGDVFGCEKIEGVANGFQFRF